MTEQTFDPQTQIVEYTTASQLAAVYSQQVHKILRLSIELAEAFQELRKGFMDADFHHALEICGADRDEEYARELKRTAWRTLIGKLNLERVMSSKRREELREALSKGKRSRHGKEDPVDLLPEINPESIQGVLMGYIQSAEEFID